MRKIQQVLFISLLFLGTIFDTASAQCTITVNSTTSGSASITATSLTISHTVSGSNTILIARASTKNGDPSSVKWNGTNLTKLTTQNNGSQYTSIWYLINPASGTHNVVINGSSGFVPIIGITSFTGVNQTTPFGTVVKGNFSNSNPSLSVSSASGELVLDVVNSSSSLTVGSGQTQQYNINEFVYYGSGSTEAGASSVTMSWSGFYASGSQIAVPLKPCGGSPLAASAGSNQNSCDGLSVSIGGSPSASGGTPSYTYSWSPSTGLNSTTIANPTSSTTTTRTYTLTVTDNTSTTKTATVSVTINPLPTASAGSSQTICNGSSVSMGGSPTASGGTSPYAYTWTPATALSSTTTANPTANPTTTTNYSVTVTDNKGCTKNATVSVTVNPLPTASAGNNQTICSGSSVSIGGSPTASGGASPYTYAWLPSTGLNSTTVANPTANPTSTTNYTVTVTDNKGCTKNTTVSVTINPLPIVNAGIDQAICNGASASIGGSPTASGGTSPYTYTWTPTIGLSSSTIANPTASPINTISYSVAVTDNNGCVASDVAVITRETTTVTLGSSASGNQVCEGSPVTFTASPSGYGHYEFYKNGNNVQTGTSNVYTLNSPTNNDKVVVTVVDSSKISFINSSCVVLNSTTTGSANTSATSLTVSHTVSGSNTLLIVRVASSGHHPTSITWNGTNLTQYTSSTLNNRYASLWYLVNPASGNYNVIINGAAGFSPIGAVSSFAGVNQSTPMDPPISNSSNNSTPSATISSNSTALVLDLVNSSNSLSAGSGQTQQYNINANGFYSLGSSKQGASSVSTSWSGSSSNWVYIAVSINSVSGCSGTPTPVYTGCPFGTSDTITTTVNNISTVTVSSNTSICAGSSTNLTAGGATTYVWSPSTGLSSTSGVTVTASPTVTTTYIVTGTNANGCRGTAIVIVTVNPLPTASAGNDQNICTGTSFSIGGSPAALGGTSPYTYSWTPATGLSSTSTANPTASFTSTITYVLTVADINGCVNIDSAVYSVENCVNWATLPSTLSTDAQGNLNKTGSDGWENALAKSVLIMPGVENGRWLKFTIKDTASHFLFGFGSVLADSLPDEANMMIFLEGQQLTIIETDNDGFYSKEIIGNVLVDDVIKIELNDVQGILYYKNDILIHTGKLLSDVRLQFTANIYGGGNAIKNIRCSSNN